MKSVRIPLAGNAFLENTAKGGRISVGGIASWSDPAAVFAVYVRFRHAASFRAALHLRGQKETSVLRVTACGRTVDVQAVPGMTELPLGSFTADREGYVRFALQGISSTGHTFASPRELLLFDVDADDLDAYISVDEKENFYWTRRGPSVHCGYDIAPFGKVTWFYNEVTVPEGMDPIGTYAMAIGFSGGYFGMQVNGPKQRRLLFSVWSPHVTDDPTTIPEDLRVICMGKHDRTHVGTFGGEGSGGQSYMNYAWKAGETYRFLMHIHPAGEQKTQYSAFFFFPETGRFERIASFIRPATHAYVEGPHSFLENFCDTNGYKTRMACFGNMWAYTEDGRWRAPEHIRLTGDNTARRGWRLDYDGGLLDDGRFYLKNGGFFDRHEQLDRIFTRDVSGLTPPDFCPDDLK